MITTNDPFISRRTGIPVTTTGKPVRGKQATPAGDAPEALRPPRLRGFTAIPTPDVLEKLIVRAIQALSAGIYWDRGSILNIVV